MKTSKNKHLARSQTGATHVMLLSLVCMALIGCSGYVFSKMKTHADALVNVNVGTYNLRSQRWDGTNASFDSWSVRSSRVKTIISQKQPGIIGMQEVIKRNPSTLAASPQRNDVLKFMKEMGYDDFVGKVDNESPIFWKTGTFSRIASGSQLVFDNSTSKNPEKPGSRYISTVRLTQLDAGRSILFFNYHVYPNEQVNKQIGELASVISAWHRSYPNDRMFFAGDFNGRVPAILAQLQKKGIYMVQADTIQGVDHILVDTVTRIRGSSDAGIGNPAASDHSMVITRLTM